MATGAVQETCLKQIKISEVSEQASDEDTLIEEANQEDTAVEEVTIEEPELNTALEINDSNAWDGITTEKTYEQDQISYIFTVKKTWKGVESENKKSSYTDFIINCYVFWINNLL